VDCTVDATSATEGRVCGVDYGIDVLSGDVAYKDIHPAI
jgi:hypothetical protein